MFRIDISVCARCSGPIRVGRDVIAAAAANNAECDDVKGAGFPGFYPEELNSGDGFALCPDTCPLMQAVPAPQTGLAECLQ